MELLSPLVLLFAIFLILLGLVALFVALMSSGGEYEIWQDSEEAHQKDDAHSTLDR
tara:strand:+ start:1124 stop:1291 length:168 start_codon:yes stop_codon:yes gene_type:complete